MRIQVLYFAGIKQVVGCSSESVEVMGSTVSDLLSEIQRIHPQLTQRHLAHTRLALNEGFVKSDASLSEGDTFALIPPVAGG